MGKTLAEARGEVAYGAEFFRWFSEEAVRIHGRWMHAPAGGSRLLTVRKPVGPCLFLTPWNFPIAMGTRKIGPAVAAGCTMVVKPAELTPLTMLALAGVMAEAGLPDGVLNVVTTSDSASLSQTLMADPRLRKVSFTGSTAVGRILVEQSAGQLQRVSMELGGNAPFLVFDDADVDAAVDGAMVAKMRNMGEACTAANRFLVHALGRRGVRRASSASGWVRCSSAAARTTGSTSDRSSTPTPVESVGALVGEAVGAGATGRSPAAPPPTGRATSTRRRCCSTSPPAPGSARRRSSGRSPRSRRSTPRRRRSRRPTRASTA